MKSNSSRCGVTKKRMFKTHESALLRGGEILNNDSNRRSTPRYFTAYRCSYCGGYHLSGKHSHDNPLTTGQEGV